MDREDRSYPFSLQQYCRYLLRASCFFLLADQFSEALLVGHVRVSKYGVFLWRWRAGTWKWSQFVHRCEQCWVEGMDDIMYLHQEIWLWILVWYFPSFQWHSFAGSYFCPLCICSMYLFSFAYMSNLARSLPALQPVFSQTISPICWNSFELSSCFLLCFRFLSALHHLHIY